MQRFVSIKTNSSLVLQVLINAADISRIMQINILEIQYNLHVSVYINKNEKLNANNFNKITKYKTVCK